MIEIWRYTAREWGVAQAELYETEILEAAGILCKHPNIGSPRLFKDKVYRKLTVGRHVIIYRRERSNIRILSVVHSATAEAKGNA
ncbi:type II toxin-antitoxin system RelE/ParE family toxin [Sphingobium boeckii]|uniref:Toxin ParE1/3/4 n=1 Tax=Sphingobium boeckii TaxID=1082345 RepID=A0A7W9AKL2_9SPHN|nr:type II toxin-antitoxin system RelE/ParE family toxin [Sphingobium boeckii]MBB5687144.1 toxin ParE1/3/4 [Sphingobium boeckii]